jgi:hypothetical protein
MRAVESRAAPMAGRVKGHSTRAGLVSTSGSQQLPFHALTHSQLYKPDMQYRREEGEYIGVQQRRSSEDTAGVQSVAEAGLRLPVTIAEAVSTHCVSRMTGV